MTSGPEEADDTAAVGGASVARGLALVAALAAVGIALGALWPAGAADGDGAPVACAVPIEVVAAGVVRLGCADEVVLSGCALLAAGDRATLGGSGCARAVGMMSAAMRLAVGLPLDLNRAAAADLELLEGVGPKLARAIVADREANGPFVSYEALDRVRGVGAATLGRLRPFLYVPASAP
ncbi:MAG: helix-hairpin-helix domain-containing protein [Deltaproteobacteria bacterium]|nr:helix-hairpin-helix domain-containing protein [Deltaproteobacteria bacterium]